VLPASTIDRGDIRMIASREKPSQRGTGTHRRLPVRLCAALAFGALSAPALAQDAGAERWRFEATPYIWGSGLDGRVRVNGKPQAGAGVEQSFSDILEMLEFAAFGTFEARKGRWALTFDAIYFRVGEEGTLSALGGLASIDADATLTQQVYSFGGSYRLVEGDSPVDVVGGLRASSVKWDVKIDSSVPGLPLGNRRFTETKDWVDPYIGARIEKRLNERWSVVGYADIGGFGVGSEFAWQVLAGANYAFKPDLIGKFGYRYIAVDYDKSDFTYDMASAGFYAGLGFRW
jgi:opacity protein-like surface antigen